jgi:hypothetical protein
MKKQIKQMEKLYPYFPRRDIIAILEYYKDMIDTHTVEEIMNKFYDRTGITHYPNFNFFTICNDDVLNSRHIAINKEDAKYTDFCGEEDFK